MSACQVSEMSAAFTSNGLSHRCADDFAFASPTTVQSLCWRGIRMRFDDPPIDCAATATDQFIVRILADDGSCVPGEALAEFSQADGTLANVERAATGGSIGGVAEYEWSATLAGGVPVDAGLRYWLEITGADSRADCMFLWMRSIAGNSSFMQDGLGVYDSTDVKQGSDLAFCLVTSDGQPLAEPLTPCASDCPNVEHDCLTEGAPGCADELCCAAMCALDSYCCSHAWDTLCVAEAVEVCPLCDADGEIGGFNIDFGADARSPRPAPSFGAASGQVGFWNVISLDAPMTADLCNLAGQFTSATISFAGSAAGFHRNHAQTAGETQNLLDDLLDLGGPESIATVIITNLPDGLYDVVTYAWAPDDDSFITAVNVNDSGPQFVGGAWPGALALGVTHSLHTVDIADGTITIALAALSGAGSVNAVQIVPIVDLRPCPADLAPPAGGNCSADGDGLVGPSDLAELLANWGADPANPCADIAPISGGDGFVGPADLGEFLASWGSCG
jgi:hypothetical protein